jgi:hypothetical protein
MARYKTKRTNLQGRECFLGVRIASYRGRGIETKVNGFMRIFDRVKYRIMIRWTDSFDRRIARKKIRSYRMDIADLVRQKTRFRIDTVAVCGLI